LFVDKLVFVWLHGSVFLFLSILVFLFLSILVVDVLNNVIEKELKIL
jgi:hypothetical protein